MCISGYAPISIICMPIYMSKIFKNYGVTVFVTMLFKMLECSLNGLSGHFKNKIMSLSLLLWFMIDFECQPYKLNSRISCIASSVSLSALMFFPLWSSISTSCSLQISSNILNLLGLVITDSKLSMDRMRTISNTM